MSHEMMTLSEAHSLIQSMCPNRRELHYQTLRRWVKDGLNGVKLEHQRFARNVVLTTRDAVMRFLVATGELSPITN